VNPFKTSSLRFLAAVALLAAALVPAACSRSSSEETIDAEVLPTITAEQAPVALGTIRDELVVRGAVSALPNGDVRVSALVPGRVTAVLVAEGDAVREGQVIAELDARPIEDQRRQAAAAVGQAQAALQAAKANFDRVGRLFEKGIAARKEVEDARTEMAAAQAAADESEAALHTADLQVERTKIVSPIAGQVVKRFVSVGEQVDGTADQPVAEIANLDAVELAANVPAEYLSKVQPGMDVTVVCATWPGRAFEGKLIALAPAVDPESNSALARIRLANPGRALKIGMFAEARIRIAEHAGALTVPPSAIVRDERGAAVYVVKGDMAERTVVTTGIVTPEAVEILTGVNIGETVLISAVHGLGDKAKLTGKQ
jgi:membrane fusion protein (multidrug efflux system)